MDISVITPFYKGNRYLQGLFASVAAAARGAEELNIELILVNDSPQEQLCYEPEWVRGFRLRVLTNEQNSGIHVSRVNGLRAAEGKFVQFLDQDDLLEENAFRTAYALARDADVVVSNGVDQSPGNRGPIYKSLAHQREATRVRAYYRMGNQIVSPGHCLIRADAIPSDWRNNFIRRNGSDDLLLWLMMFACGCRFVINPASIYTHVDTGENVSGDVSKMLASSAEVLRVLKKENVVTPEQEKQFLRSRAMAGEYVGGSRWQKLAAMLQYPDVALERLRLALCKKRSGA